MPLDQLALSPQCGFASTIHGNVFTADEQWAKLRHVVEVAETVWPDSLTQSTWPRFNPRAKSSAIWLAVARLRG